MFTNEFKSLQQEHPLQQRIHALSYVRICVAKVYTNGLSCIAVGGVAMIYNNVYTSVGKPRVEVLQNSNV